MSKTKLGNSWPHQVDKSQLEITYYKGSGGGGQRRNKRETAVRIKHLPTGLVAQSEEHAHGEQNKKAAFKRLCEKLIPIMKKESKKERHTAPEVRIRTYKEKDNLVIDERLPGRTFSYESILNGELEDLITELSTNEAGKTLK